MDKCERPGQEHGQGGDAGARTSSWIATAAAQWAEEGVEDEVSRQHVRGAEAETRASLKLSRCVRSAGASPSAAGRRARR